MASILIDDRERDKATGVGRYKRGRESIINYFVPYVEKHCAKGRLITAEVKHIVVGDYAIMVHSDTHSKLVMAIERKTLTDLAGSIKGRLNGQVQAMKELREKEECDLLIILEGATFPKKSTTYGNIPYSNLHAKLRHMLIRDKIPWIVSRNQMHTAEIVCDLAADYLALAERGDITIDFGTGILGGVPEQLTKRKNSPDDVVTLKMWCAIPGIHEHICAMLRNKYSLAQLLMGEIPIKEIAELRYASGTLVGESRAKGIYKAAQRLDSQVKAFAEIPGVSKAAATRLIDQNDEGLLGLFFMEEEEIADLSKTEKTRVGPALAKKIRKFMDLA